MNANELALVYRARGYDAEKAQRKAVEVFDEVTRAMSAQEQPGARDTARRMANPVYAESHDVVGTALGAAISSFLFFASGAIIPVLPFLLGMTGLAAVVVACTLVGIALLCTGGTVGWHIRGQACVIPACDRCWRGQRNLCAGTYFLGLI